MLAVNQARVGWIGRFNPLPGGFSAAAFECHRDDGEVLVLELIVQSLPPGQVEPASSP